jgi:hypothetical protein
MMMLPIEKQDAVKLFQLIITTYLHLELHREKQKPHFCLFFQKLISIQIPVIKDHPFPAENVEAVKAVKLRTKTKTPAGARDKGKPDVNKSHMQRPVQNSHAEHAPKILIRKAQ